VNLRECIFKVKKKVSKNVSGFGHSLRFLATNSNLKCTHRNNSFVSEKLKSLHKAEHS